MRRHWQTKSTPAFAKPPLAWLVLSFFCIIVVIAVIGSPSSSVVSASVPDYISNYRRLKEQTDTDYLDLTSFSRNNFKDLGVCSKERENFVPCYNVTANVLAGMQDGEEYNRHCEIQKQGNACLVRPPKDYKIPLRWPAGRDVIWKGNVKITQSQFLSSGTTTKRLMLLEENQIAFHSEEGDGVKDYSRQIADMIGLGSDSEFLQFGVRDVLDIECGFGSFGAYLVSLNLNAMCIAAYEATGSQVQLALERGLPAMIGSFKFRKLPFPSLSFDMVHCAQCGVVWEDNNGLYLVEVDRLIRPGGYFVLTTPPKSPSKSKRNVASIIEPFADTLCWNFIAQQDDTFIWQKTIDSSCYKPRSGTPVCDAKDETPAYGRHLSPCIYGGNSKRWLPIQNRSNGGELTAYANGIESDIIDEDSRVWVTALRNYWSLLTPLIFSDHPKRPGVEDPLPPYNMLRNVMDMNAGYGGLNAAFRVDNKPVWVMNVVPNGNRDTLPVIVDRGYAGSWHDWCEPFPTYPRTYDMLHASSLLSTLSCSMMDLFIEMDRILRPEGWVIFSDTVEVLDTARSHATLLQWDARLIDLENGTDQRLLVCQKPFIRK